MNESSSTQILSYNFYCDYPFFNIDEEKETLGSKLYQIEIQKSVENEISILSQIPEQNPKSCLFTIDDNDLCDLCLQRDQFERIVNYITKLSINEPTVIKRKESGLSYSVAYNPESGNLFILFKKHVLPLIEEGETSNVTTAWDVKNQIKVAFRAGASKSISEGECEINRILSERQDLFAATKEIYQYLGPLKRQQIDGDIAKTGFILEYVESDLLRLWANIDLKEKIRICCDIAHILDVLHNEFGIVHRDLKLENILASQCLLTKRVQTKLCDFGHAAFKGKRPKYGYGSENYMPPEWKVRCYEIEKPVADFSADIWSYGVICLLMVGTLETFESWYHLWKQILELDEDKFNVRKKIIIDQIINENLEVMSEDEKKNFVVFLDLINRCLELNPTKRVSTNEIVKITNTIKEFCK